MMPTCAQSNPRVRADDSVADQLRRITSPATRVFLREPLAGRTTLRVGGPADIYVEPASLTDLAAVVRACRVRQIPFFVLGHGSNLLVRDGGIRGVVIGLVQPGFCGVEVVGERLQCGAGAKVKAVALEAHRHGLGGLEFLEGIPGSVGGALRMNAGAMGAGIFDVVESVQFMDFEGQIHEQPGHTLPHAYRDCPWFKTHIALSAVFKAQPRPRAEIARRMAEFRARRWQTQPKAPSAGCIFKNPRAIPAGRLIDELGLKGLRVGGAVISSEHANFIVNEGGATARDILDLIGLVQQKVRAARGIELETEVEIVGEDA